MKLKTAKYMLSLNDVTFAYRATVMELCKRGFSFNTAKKMVKGTDLLEGVKESEGMWFHDMTERDCADYVERYLNKQKRIAVNF
ncbi:hypothetical protein SELR_17120 [Selenomonas ruminantium subsp. lactilytica TAM6421]|uniref:Uncharacterized protein n=1 Tax=Selenomonas ruminantium subsp. lactilytica (strain NBRC 103574 / TAM6421) TaxID=927704 RepID=I0GRN3_SELRL|nr:hypothetical protein [Selenomonas ruminantium]BAL83420.1 hypothetical protein SELR_17120 [Selenomonas ruminantium subsp. lactilytica TAM6421]